MRGEGGGEEAAQPINAPDAPTVGGLFTGRLDSGGSGESAEDDPRSRTPGNPHVTSRVGQYKRLRKRIAI